MPAGSSWVASSRDHFPYRSAIKYTKETLFNFALTMLINYLHFNFSGAKWPWWMCRRAVKFISTELICTLKENIICLLISRKVFTFFWKFHETDLLRFKEHGNICKPIRKSNLMTHLWLLTVLDILCLLALQENKYVYMKTEAVLI